MGRCKEGEEKGRGIEGIKGRGERKGKGYALGLNSDVHMHGACMVHAVCA